MSKRINFTATRVAEFQCPTGKPQAFLWDAKAPGLALRVTAHGARSYVFQSRLKEGGALRMTIGEPASWSIPDAQAEARKLQGLIDQGKDPRIERAATIAGQQAERQAAKVERAKREVSGLDAWTVYVAARQPHWGERNHADHLEPPRDSRRLRFLRGWSHEHIEEVFPRGSGAGGSVGLRAGGRPRVAVGGHWFDCGEDRLHDGDVAWLGTAGRA